MAEHIGRKAVGKSSVTQPIQRKRANTGIPAQMQQHFENVSGYSFDDVRVHYRSNKPAQIGAYAYTQGNQVYIGPGQERHLPHELGHVIQQKEGRVGVTYQEGGLKFNTDPGLEVRANQYLHKRVNDTASYRIVVPPQDLIKKATVAVSLTPKNMFKYEKDEVLIDSIKLEGRFKNGRGTDWKNANIAKGEGDHTIADVFWKKYQKGSICGYDVSQGLEFFKKESEELVKENNAALKKMGDIDVKKLRGLEIDAKKKKKERVFLIKEIKKKSILEFVPNDYFFNNKFLYNEKDKKKDTRENADSVAEIPVIRCRILEPIRIIKSNIEFERVQNLIGDVNKRNGIKGSLYIWRKYLAEIIYQFNEALAKSAWSSLPIKGSGGLGENTISSMIKKAVSKKLKNDKVSLPKNNMILDKAASKFLNSLISVGTDETIKIGGYEDREKRVTEMFTSLVDTKADRKKESVVPDSTFDPQKHKKLLDIEKSLTLSRIPKLVLNKFSGLNTQDLESLKNLKIELDAKNKQNSLNQLKLLMDKEMDLKKQNTPNKKQGTSSQTSRKRQKSNIKSTKKRKKT